MRQYALALLTVLMLMPSLACAMPMCKGGNAEISGSQPCHGFTHSEKDKGDNHAGMLIQDCLDVDFMVQDVSYDIQPDLSLDASDFAWADLSALHGLELQNMNVIRGSPPMPDEARTRQLTFLTTQRIRI